jgi:hypothetical protein
MKNILSSKRFWTGVIALITGVSIVLTGEKSFQDSLPEIILVVIGLVQTILGLMSNTVVTVSGKELPEIE